jgi:hypothetical protein
LGEKVVKKLDHRCWLSVMNLWIGFMAQEVLAGIVIFW